MVEATVLKIRCYGHLQGNDLPTELHKNLPVGSKVFVGGTDGHTHTHTHTDRKVVS